MIFHKKCIDINVRKGENSKIFLKKFFFFLTMFENYISKTIKKKTKTHLVFE